MNTDNQEGSEADCIQSDSTSSQVFELWYSESSNAHTFFGVEANEREEGFYDRHGLESDARFLRRFIASSFNEAMQEYYDFMGWGEYSPMEDELD